MTHSEEQLDEFAAWERAAWESRAQAYAGTLVAVTRGAVPALLDAAGVGARSGVLDVATGPGVVALQAMTRGAHVRAVDQAEAMVAIARANGVDARQAGAERLPFHDDSFDAVVAGFLLNHLARPERGVAELIRVLRPAGRLAMSVWDTPEASPTLGMFGPLVQSLGLPDVVPPGPDPARFADDATMREVLAGLEDVVVTRAAWTVEIDAGALFDAVAAGSPRTGAVLAAAGPDRRAELRARYIELVTASYGTSGAGVAVPAVAVVGSGAKKRK